MPDQLSMDFERAARVEKEAAWGRAELGMARAATRAERCAPGWHEAALEAVRQFAASHERFLAEDARKVCSVPADADGRAFGAIIQGAKRRGWIVKDGAAPALSSNLSLKCVWKSLIYTKESA